jgi:hypothetical protein
MWEGHTEKTLKSARTFFARWRDARARMRELTVSHRTLSILLTRDGEPGNLLIACLDPTFMRGPLDWSDAHIEIEHLDTPQSPGFRVFDRNAGMEVLGCQVGVYENVKL